MKIVVVNASLVIILLASFFSHLVIANHAANQRYEIAQFLKERTDLEAEHRRLSLEVVQLQSTERVARESARLNLVKADTITYISPNGPVALSN